VARPMPVNAPVINTTGLIAHAPIGSALPAESFRDRDHLISTSSQKLIQ